MEVKNAIIIDGVLYEAVNYSNGFECTTCSLRKECDKFERHCNEWLCKFFGCWYFINRGKVTVTPYREIPKDIGEIIKIDREE